MGATPGDAALADRRDATRAGVIAGKVSYISPDQARTARSTRAADRGNKNTGGDLGYSAPLVSMYPNLVTTRTAASPSENV